MCRFLAYKGAPVIMDKLLYQPHNSLVHQSYHALERQDPVNGDGFGIGWYSPEIDPYPALFVSVRPAWNNRNLRNLAPKIRSGCIMAHVRAAGTGAVTEPNCHPFQYGKFLMMHNGNIEQFLRIKRPLRNLLADEFYIWIKGETDSEHFFALFLHYLMEKHRTGHHYEHMMKALEKAIVTLKELLHQQKIDQPFYLNLAITNGACVVAMRYSSDPEGKSPTLYRSKGGRFDCVEGICRIHRTDPSEHAVLVVSEKLTDVQEDWHAVPHNHFVVVKEDLDVAVHPIPV